jgi:ring-1,2-phenylacetyl-CoA epoxidase subunit PaaC
LKAVFFSAFAKRTSMTKQEALFQYVLRLGDNSLVLGHRLSEWCGHGPVLEQDIAMTNISLDLLGQARNLLSYAAEVEGKGRSEDTLAYLRDILDFKNVLLTEQPNGHFGDTMTRQFFYDCFGYFLFQELRGSADEQVAAIAEKSIKEVAYHLRHSSEWMKRLGDGTAESHEKVQESVNDLWTYTGELFAADEVDTLMLAEGVGADLDKIKASWMEKVSAVLTEATIEIPPADAWMQGGGKQGQHGEHLGFLLAEMQFLPRAYPGAEW